MAKRNASKDEWLEAMKADCHIAFPADSCCVVLQAEAGLHRGAEADQHALLQPPEDEAGPDGLQQPAAGHRRRQTSDPPRVVRVPFFFC